MLNYLLYIEIKEVFEDVDRLQFFHLFTEKFLDS